MRMNQLNDLGGVKNVFGLGNKGGASSFHKGGIKFRILCLREGIKKKIYGTCGFTKQESIKAPAEERNNSLTLSIKYFQSIPANFAYFYPQTYWKMEFTKILNEKW